MADRTKIEWTEATWNPVTGCSKVSPGCASGGEATQVIAPDIVAGNVLPWSPAIIVTQESGATATGAGDQRVAFIRQAALRVSLSMGGPVMEVRRHYLQVLRLVIRLVAVSMVHDLALAKESAKQLLRDDSMLVDVSAPERGGVVGLIDLNVSIRGYSATALPVISSHVSIVAHGVLH